jgi:hypothetical protein
MPGHLKRPVVGIAETSRKMFRKSTIKTLIHTALDAPGFYPMNTTGQAWRRGKLDSFQRGRSMGKTDRTYEPRRPV